MKIKTLPHIHLKRSSHPIRISRMRCTACIAWLVSALCSLHAGELFWTGQSNDKWNTESANVNWVDEFGNPTTYILGSPVTFGNCSSANTNVLITGFGNNRPFNVTNAAITFRADHNYRVASGTWGGSLHEIGSIKKYGRGLVELFGQFSYTNNIYIYEGTLKAGWSHGVLNPVIGSFGNPSVPRYFYVGTNGVLNVSQYVFGNWSSTPAVTIEVDGGTIEKTDQRATALGPLILRNASFRYGNGGNALGFLHFNGDVQFLGTTPYNFPHVSGNNVGIGCHDGPPVTFYVEDVTGDDQVDLNWDLNIYDWDFPSKWIKDGPGTMAYGNTAMNSLYTNDLVIKQGTILPKSNGVGHNSNFNRKQSFFGNLQEKRRVTFFPGTVLEMPYSHVFTYTTSNSQTEFIFTNSTIRVAEKTFNNLGHLELYDTPIYSGEGSAYPLYSVFGLGKKLRIDGTQPFVFTNGTNRSIMVGYGTDCTENNIVSTQWPKGALYLNGMTEMEICDITQNGDADATFECRLLNYNSESIPGSWIRHFACGIQKSGLGTLQLDALNNSYTGRTEVVQGELRVNGSITLSPVTVKAGGFLAGTGTISQSVTIEEGGGFAVNAQNPNATCLTLPLLTLPSSGVLHVQNYSGPLTALSLTLPQAIDHASNFEDFSSEGWRVSVEGFTEKECRSLAVKLTADNHLQIRYAPVGSIFAIY